MPHPPVRFGRPTRYSISPARGTTSVRTPSTGHAAGIDARRIAVPEIDAFARAPEMPVASVTRMRGVSMPRAGVVRAEPLDVRRVREDAARIVAETIPLRQEVVAAVIADLLDQRAVHVADLAARAARR